MINNVATIVKVLISHLRRITGDDAYERYLQHHQLHHLGDAAHHTVLDRRTFYLTEQQRKWSGVKRCC